MRLTFLTALLLAPLASLHAAVIPFTLDKPGRTTLAVYSVDEAVQLRSLLVGERFAAGTHAVNWDGLDRDGRPSSRAPTGGSSSAVLGLRRTISE